MKGNAYLYGNKILEAFGTIPAYPPDDFLEKDYIVIKSVAFSIVRKLRFFLTDIEYEKIINEPNKRNHDFYPPESNPKKVKK